MMESYRIKELPHDTPDPDAGMTIAEMKAADYWREGVIESVDRHEDSYSVTFKSDVGFGNGLGWGRKRAGDRFDEIEPKVGDTIRIYEPLRGGSSFHGIEINGQEVFWLTPMERDAERVRWLADHDRKQRERFAEHKDELDRDFAALPEPLKKRIQRFRDKDPGFRVTSEGYELFCCVEAAKFWRAALVAAENGSDHEAVEGFWTDEHTRAKANYSKDVKGTVWEEDPGPDRYAERWLLWAWALNSDAYGYDYKRQTRVLGASDGHSGNTFGGAMSLALALLRGREEL